MAKIAGNIIPPFTGTKYGICIYKRAGQYCVRTKSSLTGKRVKKDPKFRNTMQYAGWLGDASRIASAIYREVPAAVKQFAFFRALTGEAMQLLKAGKSVPQVQKILWSNHADKKTGTKPIQQHVKKSAVKAIKKVIAVQQDQESFNLQKYSIPQSLTPKRKRKKVRGTSGIHSPPLNKPEY